MMVLSRRGAVYVLLALMGWFPVLSAVAQQHGDTVVVGPEETAHVIDSLSAQPKTPLLDSLAAAADSASGTSVDSGSMEHATVKSDPVVFRSIPNSVIDSWKKDKDFAYANDPSYWKKATPDAPRTERLNWLERLLNSDGFTWFIYFLLGAILLYAILRILSENNMRLFYRSPERTVKGPEEVSNPLEENLDAQLQEALRGGDHRLAVRWLYLKALRLLNDRAAIRYHVDATNREYVRQLAGSDSYEPFRFLTGAYERVWYGEFPLSEGSFGRLYQYFQDFYKSIGRP